MYLLAPGRKKALHVDTRAINALARADATPLPKAQKRKRNKTNLRCKFPNK